MICDYRCTCREDCAFKHEREATIGFKSIDRNE
jgi:hypothetical protein